MVNSTPRPLHPQKWSGTRYYKRLGGPQGRSESLRKFLPYTRVRSPDRPAHSELLYRLSYTSNLIHPHTLRVFSDRSYISHCFSFTLLLIGCSIMRYTTIEVQFKLVNELFIFRSVCINNEKRLLGSSCPDCLSGCQSLCLHVYARLPPDEFSWNLTLGKSMKICQKYIWLKSD